MESDADISAELLLALADHMVSDCSVTKLDGLLDTIVSYEVGEIYTLEGALTMGERFMEFRLDEDSAKEFLIPRLFAPVEK